MFNTNVMMENGQFDYGQGTSRKYFLKQTDKGGHGPCAPFQVVVHIESGFFSPAIRPDFTNE